MDYKVLIVEDEPRLRAVLCDWFRDKGDEPIPAANGAEALERLEEGEYDALLLDIMMPELDGFSVCRAARRESDVPIVFLTALSDEEDKLYGYEQGVVLPFSQLFQGLRPVCRRDRVISLIPEPVAEHRPKPGFVLHDQDLVFHPLPLL